MSAQVAGYTVSKTTPLNLSVDEAIINSKKSSSFLTHMIVMMDPQQIKANEIAKDAYEECLQLKEYLSEQLWSEVETDGISKVQAALDELTQALSKYEMTNDMIEGEWEFVESSTCCVPSY
ncbi:Mitochondrial inner membrane protease atp23 [Mucor velutinosus]|uniref:Mitochondrial inner membrane protease atp23 n=1 Tax=Mucor velutinosus TaxID=708070 RepID=A0AAN7DMG2_9FUNG|nr:Mitochondrial inner membrane protease atp23 [Mucor velutinosus]